MAKKLRIRRWMIGAALLAVPLLPSVLHVLQLQERHRELKAQIDRLAQENVLLKRQSVLLKDDPLYIEGAARKKLGVAREGEVLYRFNEKKIPTH